MPEITIELTDGRKMSFELFDKIAPITVKNFIKLANENFYDGLCFHRCIKDFMIQGGGFVAEDGALKEKHGAATIKGEFRNNGIKNDVHHGVGVISMARTNYPDSASSQFFICVADCGFLDGQYAAFGKSVDEKTDYVAEDVSKVGTHSFGYYDDVPNEPVVIKTVTVTE